MADPDFIPLSIPHMGGQEETYVAQAFAANYIAPAGAMLDRFEGALSTYTHTPHCVALSSGTAALQLLLHHYDIGVGDSVWVCSMTFIGGVSAIIHRGATPVFLDCDASYTIDTTLLAEALDKAKKNNTLPKAIISTDLFGQTANIAAIVALCHPLGIKVISDSAESLGSKQADGRHAGVGADAYFLSFNGNKIITTSGGGAILSEDQELVAHCRKLSTQAREAVPHYQHQEVGYNFRLSNICAAIGVGQMEVLDQRVQQRRAIFDRYAAHLNPVEGLHMMDEFFGCTSNRWLSILHVDAGAADIREALTHNKIEARPVWKPMHMQPIFHEAKMIGGRMCEALFQTGICLPSFTQMTNMQQDKIITTIKA